MFRSSSFQYVNTTAVKKLAVHKICINYNINTRLHLQMAFLFMGWQDIGNVFSN